MPNFVFANNVKTTLANPVSSGATTIQLASSANFPVIPAGYVWAITLNDAATGGFYEIVYATANLGGGTLRVLRGQEGTSARSWLGTDAAFAADTAGILSSFINSSQLGQFVQLSPALRQTGGILVSGSINTNGPGQFGGGVVVGGALTNATTGSFSGDVTALDFISSRTYANNAIAALPVRFTGAGGAVGLGPSSGLSAQAITASMLAVGSAATGSVVAFDTNGNIGTTGSIVALNIQATNGVSGPTGSFSAQVACGGPIFQNSTHQVVDTITSTTLSVSKSGGTYTINSTSGSQIPVGGIIPQDGTGGVGGQSVPSYGQWRVRVRWYLGQNDNVNASNSITLTAGTIVGGTVHSAQGYGSQNATFYGVAAYSALLPASTAQAIQFSFSSTDGLQANYWTLDLIRVA